MRGRQRCGGPGVGFPGAVCSGYHMLPPAPATSPHVLCQMGPCPGHCLSPAEPCVPPGSPPAGFGAFGGLERRVAGGQGLKQG